MSDLISAVKKNVSLLIFDSNVLYDDIRLEGLFNLSDNSILNPFALRNKCRRQWIAKPSTVPQGAWANAIFSSHMTLIGPETTSSIFKALAPTIAHRMEFPRAHDGPAAECSTLGKQAADRSATKDNATSSRREIVILPLDSLSSHPMMMMISQLFGNKRRARYQLTRVHSRPPHWATFDALSI